MRHEPQCSTPCGEHYEPLVRVVPTAALALGDVLVMFLMCLIHLFIL